MFRKLNAKNVILIIFSLVFYAWGEPLYVLLLLFSAMFNWFMGRMIAHQKEYPKDAKLCVTIAVVVWLSRRGQFFLHGYFVLRLSKAKASLHHDESKSVGLPV